MNQNRKHQLAFFWLERLPLIIAAAVLLLATWLPVVEIKGFDTFALETVAKSATQAVRFSLVAGLLCISFCPVGVSRWWMALSVGILFGPLADMAVRAADLTGMMQSDSPVKISDIIVIRTGTWICVAGLAFWLIDLVSALMKFIRQKKSGHQ